MLPGAHPGETNLTSMNGERRCRLSEKFMEPPGVAKADCLIAADIANTLKAMYTAEGKADMAARFAGFDWKTEEDAFNDGFRVAGTPGAPPIDSQGGGTGHIATYARLRAAGNNGVQLPIKEYKDGKLDRHRNALHRRKIRHRRRQGHLQAINLARAAADGRRPEGQAPVLDQQRPRQRSLADRLPRHVQRVRPGPLADGVRRAQSRRRASRWASRRATSSSSSTTTARLTRWRISSHRPRRVRRSCSSATGTASPAMW